jgi:hypothetical protein
MTKVGLLPWWVSATAARVALRVIDRNHNLHSLVLRAAEQTVIARASKRVAAVQTLDESKRDDINRWIHENETKRNLATVRLLAEERDEVITMLCRFTKKAMALFTTDSSSSWRGDEEERRQAEMTFLTCLHRTKDHGSS